MKRQRNWITETLDECFVTTAVIYAGLGAVFALISWSVEPLIAGAVLVGVSAVIWAIMRFAAKGPL